MSADGGTPRSLRDQRGGRKREETTRSDGRAAAAAVRSSEAAGASMPAAAPPRKSRETATGAGRDGGSTGSGVCREQFGPWHAGAGMELGECSPVVEAACPAYCT